MLLKTICIFRGGEFFFVCFLKYQRSIYMFLKILKFQRSYTVPKNFQLLSFHRHGYFCFFAIPPIPEINSGSSILYGAYKDEIIALSLSRYSSLSPLALRTQDMKDVYALAHLPLSGNLLFTSFEAAEGDAGKSTIYRLSRLSRNTGWVQ